MKLFGIMSSVIGFGNTRVEIRYNENPNGCLTTNKKLSKEPIVFSDSNDIVNQKKFVRVNGNTMIISGPVKHKHGVIIVTKNWLGNTKVLSVDGVKYRPIKASWEAVKDSLFLNV